MKSVEVQTRLASTLAAVREANLLAVDRKAAIRWAIEVAMLGSERTPQELLTLHEQTMAIGRTAMGSNVNPKELQQSLAAQ